MSFKIAVIEDDVGIAKFSVHTVEGFNELETFNFQQFVNITDTVGFHLIFPGPGTKPLSNIIHENLRMWNSRG